MENFDDLKIAILEKIPESEDRLRIHVQQSVNLQGLFGHLAYRFGTDKNIWAGWMHEVEHMYVNYEGSDG